MGKRDATFDINPPDYRIREEVYRDFRGLSANEIKLEIAHFRTAEPWRRIVLFEL